MSNKHIYSFYSTNTCSMVSVLWAALGLRKKWRVIKTTNLLSVLLVKATQKSFQWACLLSANSCVLWFSAANYVPCAQQRGSLKHGSLGFFNRPVALPTCSQVKAVSPGCALGNASGVVV